ncbi:hypothetical protein QVH35_11325 [Candidatus Nitrosotenuis chungbukensis]|uniref:hypothetical protein n=1 Tax=Candidatus Nitrosotenuis chungbukensis TaxID=1353246 RepID=UPI002672AF28|nr:hypothetical protein [Candidatus Nitrosotenuis chungbukensis]WKT57861.1 hypothetical protein QVH35_11325 [Candidatus Nitrosotenuis chungbukensis]
MSSEKAKLVKYAKDAILLIQKNISEKERKIQACQGCFEYADSKGALELSLQKTESEIEGAGKKIQELSKQVAVLKEHESLAKKLQLQDGKCPVCDSAVDRLKPIFQIEHLRQEQQSAESEIHALEQKKLALSKEKKRPPKSCKRQLRQDPHLMPIPYRMRGKSRQCEKKWIRRKRRSVHYPQSAQKAGCCSSRQLTRMPGPCMIQYQTWKNRSPDLTRKNSRN